MGNTSDIPGGLRLPHQAFLDAKMQVTSEAVLKNLGSQNNLAYTYGEGLIIYSQLEKTRWQWREATANEVGLMNTHFIYPNGWIGDGKNYSLLHFNFFPVLSQDNIKREIKLAYSIPKVSGFVTKINQLPNFNISAQETVTFKSVSKESTTVTTYYIEIIGIGKGNFGVGGRQLVASDLKVTSFGATAAEIQGIPETQIVDLGYTGVDVLSALNTQLPNIDIQGQNEGYVIIKGIFEAGIFHEYLWLGTGGLYGGAGGLQSTLADFKELSDVGVNIDKSTTAYSGTVKTSSTEADPVVYTKADADKLFIKAKIYKAGQRIVFKVSPNTNESIQEIGDFCQGFVEGQFISANYIGPNENLLTSYDI